MNCRFSTNGLSLASARSFCKFISEYLYDFFRIRADVFLERTEIETLFVIRAKEAPNLCEFLALEFSELILFDGYYYLGKGPLDEYMASCLGISLMFFNSYLFGKSEQVLFLPESLPSKLFIIRSTQKSVSNYIESRKGKVIFVGNCGVVFSGIFDSFDVTEAYQTWIRNEATERK